MGYSVTAVCLVASISTDPNKPVLVIWMECQCPHALAVWGECCLEFLRVISSFDAPVRNFCVGEKIHHTIEVSMWDNPNYPLALQDFLPGFAMVFGNIDLVVARLHDNRLVVAAIAGLTFHVVVLFE